MKKTIKTLWFLLVIVFVLPCGAQINPPSPPPPPLPKAGLLPIVLGNNSGYDNTNIYCVAFGNIPDSNQICFVKFNSTTGEGTLVPIALGQNAQDFSFSINQMPTYPGGSENERVIYLPHIVGSRLYFSVEKSLNMPVKENDTPLGLGIETPNFTNSSDPNFATAFDWYEIAFTNDNVIGANGTGVDAFCLPLYGYISTPNGDSINHSGVAISKGEMFQNMRDAIAANASNADGLTPEGRQWQNLITQYDNEGMKENFRILSPFKASEIQISGSTNPQLMQFDPNYFDNEEAYGFSYLKEIWYGENAYYKTHDLYIEIPVDQIPGVRSRKHYNGRVNSRNQFVFTQVDRIAGPENKVVLRAPTDPSQTFPPKTTTQQIFGGEDLTESQLISDSPDGIQCSKFLEELIISGLAPITREYVPNLPPEQQKPLTEDFMNGSQSLFYKKNSNLSVKGQATGPWYSLYAKAIHDFTFSLAKQTGQLPKTTPTTYAFAYDEPLWPQVLITSGNLYPTASDPRVTYLAVTLLNSTSTISGDSVTIDIDSSANPAVQNETVTFTATLIPNVESLAPPTGTVTFVIDGVATQPVSVVNGKASYSASSLSLGNHQVNVLYSGDFFFDSGAGVNMCQVIVGQYATLNINSSSNPSLAGKSVVFTVGVLPSFQGATRAKGSVTLFVDGVLMGKASLKKQVAQIKVKGLVQGTHAITAKYSGSKNYPETTSEVYAQTVIPIEDNHLSSSMNPSTIGEEVVFTFQIAIDPEKLSPTGNVLFVIDKKKVAKVSMNKKGVAKYKTNRLRIGKHIVKAFYSGDSSYDSTSSLPIKQIVKGKSN